MWKRLLVIITIAVIFTVMSIYLLFNKINDKEEESEEMLDVWGYHQVFQGSIYGFCGFANSCSYCCCGEHYFEALWSSRCILA